MLNYFNNDSQVIFKKKKLYLKLLKKSNKTKKEHLDTFSVWCFCNYYHKGMNNIVGQKFLRVEFSFTKRERLEQKNETIM